MAGSTMVSEGLSFSVRASGGPSTSNSRWPGSSSDRGGGLRLLHPPPSPPNARPMHSTAGGGRTGDHATTAFAEAAADARSRRRVAEAARASDGGSGSGDGGRHGRAYYGADEDSEGGSISRMYTSASDPDDRGGSADSSLSASPFPASSGRRPGGTAVPDGRRLYDRVILPKRAPEPACTPSPAAARERDGLGGDDPSFVRVTKGDVCAHLRRLGFCLDEIPADVLNDFVEDLNRSFASGDRSGRKGGGRRRSNEGGGSETLRRPEGPALDLRAERRAWGERRPRSEPRAAETGVARPWSPGYCASSGERPHAPPAGPASGIEDPPDKPRRRLLRRAHRAADDESDLVQSLSVADVPRPGKPPPSAFENHESRSNMTLEDIRKRVAAQRQAAARRSEAGYSSAGEIASTEIGRFTNSLDPADSYLDDASRPPTRSSSRSGSSESIIPASANHPREPPLLRRNSALRRSSTAANSYPAAARGGLPRSLRHDPVTRGEQYRLRWAQDPFLCRISRYIKPTFG